MASPAKPAVNPIALKQGEGEALWFNGALVIVKASGETTAGRVTVIEHLAPEGSGQPVHVHHREDEWFYVIEGALTFWVGGQSSRHRPGRSCTGREIPHTFIVTSPQARSLVVTEPAGFEKFMRALGEPAAAHTIPPASVPLPATGSWQPRQSSGSKYSARQHPYLAEPSCPDGVVTSPSWDTSVPPPSPQSLWLPTEPKIQLKSNELYPSRCRVLRVSRGVLQNR